MDDFFFKFNLNFNFKLTFYLFAYLHNYNRFVFKVVITSTAVYYTNQLEIWSALSRKERAYDQLISCAKQYIAKNTPDTLKLKVISSFQVFISVLCRLRISIESVNFCFGRFKKFKTINCCFVLQPTTTTIKVSLTHSKHWPIYLKQLKAYTSKQSTNCSQMQPKTQKNRTK